MDPVSPDTLPPEVEDIEPKVPSEVEPAAELPADAVPEPELEPEPAMSAMASAKAPAPALARRPASNIG